MWQYYDHTDGRWTPCNPWLAALVATTRGLVRLVDDKEVADGE